MFLQAWSCRWFTVPALITLSCWTVFAGREYPLRDGESAFSNRLIVRLVHGTAPDTVAQSVMPGATVLPVIKDQDIYVILLPESTPGRKFAIAQEATARERSVSARLAARQDVIYVEPDRVRRADGITPNDPQMSSQWALQTIQAPAGWGTAPDYFLTASASTSRIKIAVLDTGADCTHPDFINAGGSSTDSASGGQFSFALSAAYYPTTVSPAACAWQDDLGHGTHVAGILGASANNGSGIAGLGYPFQMIIYKVLFASNGNAYGADSVIAQGITDAVNNGATIISMSLSGAGYSPTMQTAINYAWQNNVLVVASAGNSASSALYYPGGANYAVGVGATDTNDAAAGFSNFGPQVHVAAPGVNIFSTLPGAAYGYLSGTSMAAPLVSGLAGLLAMASPGISAAALAMRIEQSADNSNAGGAADPYLGYGRINVAHALSGPMRATSQGGITGQIVDSTYMYPISGVTVSVGGQTITTDSTGLYRFYGLAPGQYTLTSVSTGAYAPLSQQVMVAPGADTPFTVVMGGTPATFTGTVNDNGQPVAGAIVQAVSNGLATATAVTGANGQYFLYVQPGTYTLTTSGMYQVTTSSAPQTIAGGATTTVTLALPAMGQINGNIKLSNGAAATNATVNVSNGSTSTSAPMDANGNYTTIGLPAGGYNLVGSLPGRTNLTASATVGNDSSATVNLQFPNNGLNTLFVLVTAKTGALATRQWTYSFQNNGTQTVSGVTLVGLRFVQQGGPACTPLVTTQFPSVIGDVAPGAIIMGTTMLNFSGCGNTSRFQMILTFTGNAQVIAGTATQNNQFP